MTTALAVLDPIGGTRCSIACNGDCCRRFVMGGTPESRKEKAVEIRAWRDAGGNVEDSPWMVDYLTIDEMLVDTGERCGENGKQIIYRCANLDDATGHCTIYERRPEMCRRFPSYQDFGLCRMCGATAPAA